MSGNSPWDRWRYNREESAVSAQVKAGHELFQGKANCAQCHLGNNFTDGQFHNIGVGGTAATRTFKDEGRWAISRDLGEEGRGLQGRLIANHSPSASDCRAPTRAQLSISSIACSTLRCTASIGFRAKNARTSAALAGPQSDEIPATISGIP